MPATPELDDTEKAALIAELKQTIATDPFPRSPRVRTLRAIPSPNWNHRRHAHRLKSLPSIVEHRFRDAACGEKVTCQLQIFRRIAE
jgi:hypothetical protein